MVLPDPLPTTIWMPTVTVTEQVRPLPSATIRVLAMPLQMATVTTATMLFTPVKRRCATLWMMIVMVRPMKDYQPKHITWIPTVTDTEPEQRL